MSAKKIFFTALILLADSLLFSLSKNYRIIQADVRITQISPLKTKVSECTVYFDNVRNISAEKENNTSVWTNGTLSFKKHNGKVSETDSAKTIQNLKSDMMNWFQDDLGLTSNGFEKISREYNGGEISALWLSTSPDETIIQEVRTYTNSSGRIERALMYLDENTLLADTHIEKYTIQAGRSCPERIESKIYDSGQLVMTTKIEFSNIKFNSPLPEEFYSFDDIRSQTVPSSMLKAERFPVYIDDFSGQDQQRRISNLKILLNASFTFYKKFITNQDMSSCSYRPTCSVYMRQAVSKHGLFGIIIGLERLDRCTSTEKKRRLYPLTAGGLQLDPVK